MISSELDRPAMITLARLGRRLDEPRFAVPVLLLLALVLRLPNLGESLWIDEVLYSTHYRSADLHRLWQYVAENPGPPLYPVLTFFWVALAGDHELSVRMPSLILGLGSVVLTYLIARRFSRRGAPFLAGVLLCFSPAHVWYSQEATPYAMTMFFLLTAVFVWPRVTSSPFSWTSHATYLCALLAAAFTHYYAAAFLLPFTLLSARAEKPIRHTILLAHAVVVMALVLWLAAQYQRGSLMTGQGFLRPFTIFEWWMLFFHWFLQGNSLWTISPYRATPSSLFGAPWLLGLQIVFAIILLRGFWPRRGKESPMPAGELALHLWTLPFIVYLLTLAGYRNLYIERYMLIGLPFFVIVLARGATGFSRATVRAAVTCAVLAVGIASYAALLNAETRWTVYKQNPDWQSAARFLQTQNTAGERMVLVGVIPLDDLDFYLGRQMANGRPPIHWYIDKTFDRFVASGQATQIVVVKNLAWSDRTDSVIKRCREDPRLRLASVRSFKLVELYSFVPTARESFNHQ